MSHQNTICDNFERDNPYHFFRANQQQSGSKIFSLNQCSLSVNWCDWHILAGNDERINSHCLTRVVMLPHFRNNIYNFPKSSQFEIKNLSSKIIRTISQDVWWLATRTGWNLKLRKILLFAFLVTFLRYNHHNDWNKTWDILIPKTSRSLHLKYVIRHRTSEVVKSSHIQNLQYWHLCVSLI